MNILEIIKQDYQNFPTNPTYSIYAEDVYFKDPMTEFRGIKRYKSMIQFMATWFKEIKLDLHKIYQSKDTIHAEWTLHWITPLPWKPPIAIAGRSELVINSQNLIISHIDYWNCSRWDVLKQHFPLILHNKDK
ncbi:conserved hypothetical protein [Rippkaea orientalis PCC 8801]|uniref:SnoaL-like domain-containing protein n=1 Tax=Rippkaea orientalis (strain PCC 8801 / RF-1) TaxID=41431 RepID=B7K1M1_RIPO1|nr:DUF2358 domain-containing protein [Rippkaea orientalis]ACK67563.1 conserved hypothetical protein [Rippkaea orientalis PCC 8801]